MDWNQKVVAITGAGSGIGRELTLQLVRRGATVWTSDVDDAGAAQTKELAGEHGDSIHVRHLDVVDAEAVRRHIDEVVAEHGRIDVMFNNAGIGVGGEAHELTVGHFDRCLDINVRGVTNGVVAVWNQMARQGSGLLVNTASAAGLLGVPLMSPYSMTKHAVVGLTRSLRLEGAQVGITVCALCPTAIETAIIDKDNPQDLDPVWRPDIRKYLTLVGGPPVPVDVFVRNALRQIDRGREIIVEPRGARLRLLLGKWMPFLMEWAGRRAYREVLADRPAGGSNA